MLRLRQLSCILFVVCLCSNLYAQTFRGGIEGTVLDRSGAAITQAEVTVRNSGTGLTRSITSDDEGNFSFAQLPLGVYDISASKAGFATRTIIGVNVATAANARVDLELAAGEVKEQVDVIEDVPLINTTSNTLGGTIEARQAEALPVNGRDFTKLLVMVPGATGDPSGAVDSPGSFGLFSANGNRGRSNNYLLDGTDMNDGYRNLPAINEGGVFGTPGTVLPIDALAEIPVLAQTDAQYGRNSGAIVNLVTKSGTNEFHGSLYEYFRNNALDARNYFNAKPQPQNGFHNNQFGGSFGGPIIRDKTFFFGSYEGQREAVGIPSLARVPTQAEIAAAGGATNPVIASLLALDPWPDPNRAPDANGNNLQATTKASNRADSLILKADHNFGAGDLFTGRYFFGDTDQSFPLALVGGGVLPGFNTVSPIRVQIASLSYTHVFTPKFLMEVRGGYNRYAQQFLPEDRSFDPSSIGLNTTTDPRNFGLPLIRVSGYATLGSNAGNPRGRVDTNTQFFVNGTYTAGGHSWRMGGEFRRTFVNQFFNASYRGVLDFDDLAGFLAGTPGGGRQAQGDSRRGTHQNNVGFFAQDSWRVTRKLTANYGLRWDYFGVIGEEKDRLSFLDSSSGLVLVGSGANQLYPSDWNNFAPRVGLAYDLRGDGKTVVRAAWGVYYDAYSQDFFIGQLPFNTFNPGPAYNGIGPSPITFNFSPAGTIVSGEPVFAAADFAATDVFTVDQNIRTPYVQNYSVNVQQELSRNIALQVGYVGSAGRKLYRYRDINQGDPATGAHPFDNGPFAPDGSTFFYVNQFESTAGSNYNSLQTSLRVRGLGGFSSTMNYTYSKSIDNASDGQDYVPNASQPDNSFRPDRERARSNFDQRHKFQWFWIYGLPQFQTAPWLTNEWQISGVVALQSGMPFNVNYLFEDDFNNTGEFFGRPDLVGDPFAGTRTPDSYLNLSAFQVPCTFDGAAGACTGGHHFGNLGRNAFTGPEYRNFDFSIAKTQNLTEKLKMELRADLFNIFNHPNFSNPLLPNFGVDFAASGLDATGRGVGFLPITATPDVGIGNPFLGGGGPRNIQLAVRFLF